MSQKPQTGQSSMAWTKDIFLLLPRGLWLKSSREILFPPTGKGILEAGATNNAGLIT